MTRNQELEQLVKYADRSLQKARISIQASDADVADAQRALGALFALCRPSAAVPTPDKRVRIAITNGHRLCEEQLLTLDTDNYDVILDMTNFSLTGREEKLSPRQLKVEKKRWLLRPDGKYHQANE
jgi:hypothetical protein